MVRLGINSIQGNNTFFDGNEALAKRTMAKVTARLIPVAAALYFVSYIDRSNLGFAGLTMNRDLGFSRSRCHVQLAINTAPTIA